MGYGISNKVTMLKVQTYWTKNIRNTDDVVSIETALDRIPKHLDQK